MTPLQRAKAELETQLQKQNFDFTSASPLLAWEAFKLFLEVTLPYKTVGIGVEILNVDDRDDVLYLEYARRLQDEHGGERDIVCLFSRVVPQEMAAINKSFWWHEESENLHDYFAGIEAAPEFIKCMELDNWEWES